MSERTSDTKGVQRAFTPGLQANRDCLVSRRRDLPIKGEIAVAIGDVVTADTIVARASLLGELRLVRAAEQLGLPPSDTARALKVKVGDVVSAKQVLAELVGLWGLLRSTVLAPIDGVVEYFSETTGHLGIRAAPTLLELSAYMAGRVTEIIPGSGVIIENRSTFVQGIFGVGGERHGVLDVLPIGTEAKLSEENIPAECRGKILVGGHTPTIAALRRAAVQGAVGLVTGSIDDTTLRDFVGYDIGVAITGDEPISMTLIVTEGFGSIPMGQRVWNLLSAMNGRASSINGATQVRAGAVRPEIIVAHPETTESPTNDRKTAASDTNGALQIGSNIRLIRVPYFGAIGTVVELPHDPEKIETGAVARILRAKLVDGSVVTVPRANVERVEFDSEL